MHTFPHNSVIRTSKTPKIAAKRGISGTPVARRAAVRSLQFALQRAGLNETVPASLAVRFAAASYEPDQGRCALSPIRLTQRPAATLRRSATAAAGIAVLAVGAAGCGSSSSSQGSTDPAAVVPASAPIYVSAMLRPSGSLKSNAVSVATKLSHRSDPFGALVHSLERSGHNKVDYSRDIKPWLGNRAGVFFTSLSSSGAGSGLVQRGLGAGSSFGSGGTEGAIVVSTTDTGKARSYLSAQARRNGSHSATYKGVGYQLASDGTADGLVGKFAVIGSESGFKSVVDTQQGAPAITSASGYTGIKSTVSSNALGDAYVNLNGLLDSIRSAPGSSSNNGLLVLRQLFASSGTQNVDVALTVPNSSTAGIEATTTTSKQPPAASHTGAQVLGALPGNSWLALGIGDLGGSLNRTLTTFSRLGSFGGVNFGQLLRQLNAQAGFNVQRDLFSWMGGTGVFVSGAGLTDLNVGVVIDSKNPALSRAAVTKIGRLLQKSGTAVRRLSLPGTDAGIALRPKNAAVTIDVVDGHGKFVVGLGDASTTAALHPSTTMSSSGPYRTAVSGLDGIQPSFLLDFPTLLNFIEGLGQGSSPSFQQIKPYLQSLTTLAAGGQRQGNVSRTKLVLGVR
jgi:hypothetical protein